MTYRLLFILTLLKGCFFHQTAFGQTPMASDPTPAGNTPVTITVLGGERQRFSGFGVSIANFNNHYDKLPQKTRDELTRMIWHDLKFRTLRLWMQMHEYAPQAGQRDLSVFRHSYINSGVIADARKAGAETLLLAPDNIPEYMRETRADGSIWLKPSENGNYAALLADFIGQLKKDHGIVIHATGIQNESSDQTKFGPDQMADVVAKLRDELDSRGLQSVKIIASENASANEIFDAELKALQANAPAWKALSGIASHSYNMAATEKISSHIAAPDGGNLRDYWMTEAGANGHEERGDLKRALNLSGRFLNDLNHRVTHWIHFLAYENVRLDDNATCILTFTHEPPAITRFLKYDTYKQLSDTFDIGARLRHSQSSLEGEMEWSYGLKPRITSATARNPDGSWAIGIVNYTAPHFDGIQGWSEAEQEMNRSQGGHTPGQTFQVNIEIAELKNSGPVIFQIFRTNADMTNTPQPTVTMSGGKLRLDVSPLELVTMRSSPHP